MNDFWHKRIIELDENKSFFFFAYGSLKRKYKHHYLLGKTKFLGNAETKPNYLLYDTGPYPGMIKVKSGEGREIEGELYHVDFEIMQRLSKIVPAQFKVNEVAIKNFEVILNDFSAAICLNGKKDFILFGKEKSIVNVTHIWDYGVDRFLDCGTIWPRI